MKNKPAPHLEYISLSDFSKESGISLRTLRKKAKNGEYKTIQFLGTGWRVQRWELEEMIKDIQAPEHYITVEQYAKDHGLSSATLRNHIYAGKYTTAQKYGDIWYIDPSETPKTGEESRGDYLTVSEYAELHGMERKNIFSLVSRGLLKSKRVGKRGIYLIHKDEPLFNLIAIHKYAERCCVAYLCLLQDIKKGKYQTAVNISGRWFISENEPCKTNTRDYSKEYLSKHGYIRLGKYAKIHGQPYTYVYSLVEKGLLPVIQDSGNRLWYILESHPFTPYILWREYADLNHIPYKLIADDLKNNRYKTAVFTHGHWYIDKTEQPVTPSEDKTKFIPLMEYADRYGVRHDKMRLDVHNGFYSTAIKIGGRWYIDENEPCLSSMSKEKQKNEFIPLELYATLRNLSYEKVLKDARDGRYYTAYEEKGCWYVNRHEYYKH